MLTQTHTVVNSRFFSLPHTPICAKKKIYLVYSNNHAQFTLTPEKEKKNTNLQNKTKLEN